ncbi:MAG: ABC-F family ATP-binding cassette domain-containing protein, partial [Chlamydiia bacterium]|nr:ABC-F family ATP-binding cassette domain-containing protein [Chlamydiia bacterium]
MSLTLDQLGMRFGGKILFQKVSLQLNPGHRYGLVGANGAGKTTLLRILMDEVEADQGGVRHPKDLRIGCLQQDQFLYDEARIVDVVVMGNERLWEAMERKEVLLGKKELSDADGNELAELESIISHEDGYSAEGRAGRLLQGLGIPADRHTLPMRTLSGGYRLRVLLAQLFFSEPDVLLLDEPTNHLDVDAK